MSATSVQSAVKYFLSILGVIAVLLLTGANIQNLTSPKKVLGTNIDTSPLQKQKSYWEEIVKKNPTYRDGYLELALINHTLGDKESSIKQFEKAKTIDPNSIKVREVQTLLGF